MRKIDHVKITMASPETIMDWTNGEVKKPETINYRTFKPERDGLFCEKIFGPTKEYECSCGKYKGKKYEGTVCERCGVRIEPKSSRSMNMGHIELAAPVVHLWYLKSMPSILANLLNIASKDLENIIYFGSLRIIEKMFMVVKKKNAPFDCGDILSETEFTVYKEFWDFEAEPAVIVKNPMGPVRAEIGGQISITEEETHTGKLVNWVHITNKVSKGHTVHKDRALNVRAGDRVEEGQELASEQTCPVLYSPIDGTVDVDEGLGTISIEPTIASGDQPVTFSIPYDARLIVKDRTDIKKGDPLVYPVTRDAIKAKIAGEVAYGKDLTVASFSDGRLVTTFNGQILVENVSEEKNYPIFEGSLINVNEGEIVEKDAHIADRFAYEGEILSLTEYKMLEDHYPNMFDTEAEIESDRPILVITEIDEAVSQEIGKQVGEILTDNEFEAFHSIYPGKIEALTGAEAIKILLEKLDIEKIRVEIEDELRSIPRSNARVLKLRKRMKIVKDLLVSSNAPTWMILNVVPVIPPDLRPMIHIEGGRFATIDLNDLYRRVINRNNRLAKLMILNAPDVIVRNEKRMLQQAVDSLIYNGRMSKPITDRGGRPLKSLTDLLKGKKGRFRRNLLGKRVDYSGRAVIVPGPELKIHECGIPKKMAMELFKPFVLAKLLGGDTNSKTARNLKKAIIEKELPQAWEALEAIAKKHPVILNRSPTLHRMSIQAFFPRLVEGNTIQLHPLVCPPFNADFDGDQMAVHVPLSAKAQAEATFLLLSRYNIISPANGQPVSIPSKDIVLGVYYLTMVQKDELDQTAIKDINWRFSSLEEAILAMELSRIRPYQNPLELHTPVLINTNATLTKTTIGKAIWNEIIPTDFQDYQKTFGKKQIKELIYEIFKKYGIDRTAELLDDIKDLGFHYATQAGLTISVVDVVISPKKKDFIRQAEKKIKEIEAYYRKGFLTTLERKREIIKIWDKTTELIQKETYDYLGKDLFNPLYMMVASGARGNIDQIKQLSGMRGLMIDSSGEVLENPIRSNFREGLNSLEYFLSARGGRKVALDTALRTADAGYLTRRLVDVSQGIIVLNADCGTHHGIEAMALRDEETEIENLENNIFGRVLAEAVIHPRTGEVLRREDDLNRPYDRDVMLDDNDAVFLANFSQKLDVKKTYVLQYQDMKKDHHSYIELDDNIFASNGMLLFKAGTPINWHMMEECNNHGISEISVIEFPVVGNYSRQKIRSQDGKRVLLLEEEKIDPSTARFLAGEGVTEVEVRPTIKIRTVFDCEAEDGVCAKCYGMDLSNHKIVSVGEAVGIIAAQSIGEPGTQLTMRTFHTGGIASALDITQGLRRAEELFEARKNLKENPAIFSRIRGFVKDIKQDETGKTKIYVEDYDGGIHEYELASNLKTRNLIGDKVLPGSVLSTGALRPRELMQELEVNATFKYLLREIKKVYSEQGVEIHNKHIELIIKQMLSKVEVINPGDTDFLIGDQVLKKDLEKANAAIADNNANVEVNRAKVLGCKLATSISVYHYKYLLKEYDSIDAFSANMKLLNNLGYCDNIIDNIGFSNKTYEDFYNVYVHEYNKYNGYFDKDKVFSAKWKGISVLTIFNQSKMFLENKNGEYESILFISIELSDGQYYDTNFRSITYEINKLFQIPVFLIFNYKYYGGKNNIAIALAERRFSKISEEKDVLDSIFITKDISFSSYTIQHEQFLYSICKNNIIENGYKINNIEELYRYFIKSYKSIFNNNINEYGKAYDIIPNINKEEVITSDLLNNMIRNGIKEIPISVSGSDQNDLSVCKFQIAAKEQAAYRQKISRITKVAIDHDSWLSSASFQQTSQVLVENALKGSIDYLKGLKENIIVGNQAPCGTGHPLITCLESNIEFRDMEEDDNVFIETYNELLMLYKSIIIKLNNIFD